MAWIVYVTYKSAGGEVKTEFETESRARAEKEYTKWLKHPDRYSEIRLVQFLKDRRNPDRTVERTIQKNRGYTFDDPIPF